MPPTRKASCSSPGTNGYQDRDGSVLDNTIVLFGSGASTTHNSHNLPTLIAGGANMGLKHGIYWRERAKRGCRTCT
jgi:hypothetical protein